MKVITWNLNLFSSIETFVAVIAKAMLKRDYSFKKLPGDRLLLIFNLLDKNEDIYMFLSDLLNKFRYTFKKGN